jgi:Ni/Fe-hydrogenase 1 B-type cytochrome subunit
VILSGEGIIMIKDEKMRVYVWEFPVRGTHWINFFCILILSVTGYYMGSTLDNAVFTKQYVMGWIRLIHFIAAYTLLMSFITRIYWSLVGNRYADMVKWIPLTRERMVNLMNDIKHHLVLDIKSTSWIGHTPLGSFVFLILHIILIISIATGFAMYSAGHTGESWGVLGEWIKSTMPIDTVKIYHKLLMHIILSFVPVHIFMSSFHTIRNRNRLIHSIFSGYKVIARKYLKS